MNLGSPSSDLLPGPRGRLLVVLAQLGRPATVRELARFAGASPQAALDVVNDLADVGLVSVERAGRALMVSLVREHLLAEPLLDVAQARQRLVRRLSDELAGWRSLAGAWLFGSAARGDGDRRSDVDILVVSKHSVEDPAWVQDSGRLRIRARAWTGNDVQLVEHTRDSFSRLVRERNPLVASVRADGVALVPRSGALLREAAA